MSGIESWSTTPANNNQSPPFGWPAGILPSQVEPIGRQMMTSLAAWYQAAEWINYNLTPTYVSGTQFTLVGNDTAIYHVGRRVKATDGSTNVYGTITVSAFTTLTTVTVVWDSGVLQTGVTIVYVGITSAVNTSAPALSASAFANPSASIGLAAVNGSAATAMRSDAAPALSQAISPTWTGAHVFAASSGVVPVVINAPSGQVRSFIVNSANAAGAYAAWQQGGTDIGFVGSAAAIITSGSVSDLAITNSGAHAVVIGSNSAARVVVSGTGNVTINASGSGTNSLSVSGAANGNAIIVGGSATTGQSYGLRVNAGTNSADLALHVYDTTSATSYFRVRGDGLVQAVDQGGTLQDVGWRDVPQNSQAAGYTAALSDRGKYIYMTSSGTFTIPANASIAFPNGTTLTFVNLSGGNSSIAITTDSMIWAGQGTTGTRTLANNGIATAVKVNSTTWLISGSGLS